MTQTNDANSILMGGGGSPAWKFDGPGTVKQAKIVSPPQAKQEREYDPNNPGGGAPKVFPSGDPIMGVTVEVQTNERDSSRESDDGKRTFFIEGKRLKDAVRAGVRTAGAAGLEVGGILNVELTHYDVAGDRRSGCNWRVVYTPAGNAAVMSVQAPAVQAAPLANDYGTQVGHPAPAPAPAAPAAADPNAEQLAAFQAWQAQQQSQQSA